MKYHTLFFRKLRKMLQKLPFAAVVIGSLRVNTFHHFLIVSLHHFVSEEKIEVAISTGKLVLIHLYGGGTSCKKI